MPIRCEINFPLLPTLSDEERQCRTFVDPVAVHVARRPDEVAGVLDALVAASGRGNWCVGFVAHEAAAAFDSALQTRPADGCPLAWFAEFAQATEASLPEASIPEASISAGAAFTVSAWRTDTSSERFAACVESIRADIREGRFYQVNYTTRLNADFAGDALMFYRALQAAQPRGYHAFIDAGEFQLLSVSPELFFSLRDGVVTTQPMKGTAPRGDTAEEDAALAEVLTHSAKERAENLMIVDLLRNDLSRLATPNSVEVPHLFSLHPLPSVWQMTSTVRARLRQTLTLKDVFAALFPCGSVTGAPKVEAMRAIVELESSARGTYCGAIGMVAPDSTACFNVGIRSVWIENGRASFGVGSGITYDSTVEGEAAELVYKARFVQRASTRFDLFETIRLQEGEFTLLARHLDRMENSARHFRFRFDRRAAISRLEAVKQAHERGVWRCRLSCTVDGELSAVAVLLEPVPERPLVQLAASPVSSFDEFLQHKTTRRETYDLHAPASSGAFDTLLWNERGELTEFTRANLVLRLGEDHVTPSLPSGFLNGTLRDELLASGRIAERVLSKSDLQKADSIYWVNALRGQIKVSLVGAASSELSVST